MLKKDQSAHLMVTAVGRLAKRSEARFPTAAGGRSSALRSKKTVGELDRRRSHEISPNSRQSRRGASRRSSSHSQGRDIVMDVAFKSFVGIDIAKRTLDVHVLPERTSLKQQNDSKGRGQLRQKLPAPGVCLIVVEATGGYERALVAELIDAGYQVAVVNPTSPRLRQSLRNPRQDRSDRRGRAGTLRAGRRAAHPGQNSGKTVRTARSRRPPPAARRAANRRNEPQRKRRQQVCSQEPSGERRRAQQANPTLREANRRTGPIGRRLETEGRDCSKRAGDWTGHECNPDRRGPRVGAAESTKNLRTGRPGPLQSRQRRVPRTARDPRRPKFGAL